MADLTVPALLTTAVTGLAGTVAFLFYRLEQQRAKCAEEVKALNESFKTELRDNGKATAQQLKDTLAAINRLCDLEERRSQ